MKLTQRQKDMLRIAASGKGSMGAGRGGWSTAHVKRLEALGLVRFVSAGSMDSTYRLTEAGWAAGEAAIAEERAAMAVLP